MTMSTQDEPSNKSIIPAKLYFNIGEVAQLCQLKPHVLRYWEQEFSQLKPNKRRGNRRYYQQKEVALIFRIKELLYQEGYTIEGAKQRLIENSSGENDLVLNSVIKNILAQLETLVIDLQND